MDIRHRLLKSAGLTRDIRICNQLDLGCGHQKVSIFCITLARFCLGIAGANRPKKFCVDSPLSLSETVSQLPFMGTPGLPGLSDETYHDAEQATHDGHQGGRHRIDSRRSAGTDSRPRSLRGNDHLAHTMRKADNREDRYEQSGRPGRD
jgi:hypothetical protein